MSGGDRFGKIFLNSIATGNVTSPNYPDNYPNSVRKTETIQVEQGLILSLQFTAFDIQADSTCDYDHLTITDGDGTTLMEKSCGTTLPANITSTSNIVKLVFNTSSSTPRSGWSISWMAVTPGECQQYVLIFDDLSKFFRSIIVDDLTFSYFLDTSLPSFPFRFSFIFIV